MDWIKFKAKHLSPEYTDIDLGALVRIQLLTAQLERIPSERELNTICTQKRRNRIEKVLEKQSFSLQKVMKKVLEDVEDVVIMRSKAKNRQRKSRGLQVLSQVTTTSCHATDKRREEDIREEDIREEKINIPQEFLNALKLFPGTTSKTQNWNAFKKHKDWKEVLVNLCNHIGEEIHWREKSAEEPEYNFVPPWKNFSTWINQRCWEQTLPKVKGRFGEVI